MKEEWRRTTLRERIDALVESCDAAIALPGGVGTLLEICMTWNLLVINALEPKPLILIGDGWKRTMETFFAELDGYVSMSSKEYLAFVPNPKTALIYLEEFLDIK